MRGKQTDAEKGRVLLEIQPFWPIFGVTTSCRKAVRETLRFPNSKPRPTVVLLLMGCKLGKSERRGIIFGVIAFRQPWPIQPLSGPGASTDQFRTDAGGDFSRVVVDQVTYPVMRDAAELSPRSKCPN